MMEMIVNHSEAQAFIRHFGSLESASKFYGVDIVDWNVRSAEIQWQELVRESQDRVNERLKRAWRRA